MSARKSNGLTKVFPYRVTQDDENVICTIHGKLAIFLNKCIAKEVKRIEKLAPTKKK